MNPVRLLALGILFAAVTNAAAAQRTEPPETTIDGLVRVPDSKVGLLYVQPGATLSPYARILLLDPHVSFVAGYKNRMNDRLHQTARVTDADMENMKVALARLFREEFTDELQNNGGYVLVDGVADDVLALRPAIIDLDVTGPELSPNLRSAVPSVGEMMLYLELVDSVSGDILVKVLDHQFDRTRVNTALRNRDRNERAFRAMLRNWAVLMREALDEAHRVTADDS